MPISSSSGKSITYMIGKFQVFVLKCGIVLEIALASSILPQEKQLSNDKELFELLKAIIQVTKSDDHSTLVRRTNDKSFAPVEALFQSLKRDINSYNSKRDPAMILHHQAPPPPLRSKPLTEDQKRQAAQDETELKNIANKQRSTLMNTPYLMHKGKNDYLVMKQPNNDPFVTVVPNDIYYNIEKKCINWLDSCTLQGIRNHLLQKVRD